MNWTLLDHTIWQTLITLLAVITAYIIGRKQIKISDTVELYASLLLADNQNSQGNIISRIPFIHIQNVGTKLVYFDKYIFNGREYSADSQILPSTYSQAQNNFYRIALPTNNETYVSLEVFYHDLDERFWSTKIVATKSGPFGWDLKTLPRKPASPLF